MAAFMARLYQAITGKAVPLTKNIFHDTSDSFAADDIRRILGLGVTQGTGRGTFSPPQNVVTREQMAAFPGPFVQNHPD